MADPRCVPLSPAKAKPGYITWPNLFSILVVVLLAASYFGMMGDLDWAWQVRTGELIIETGSLRTPESFSYTINGAQVHDFEWLYEVTIYYVWSVFGIGGLKFLKMAAIATPLILLGWRLKREGVRWHGIALSFFVAVWILSGAWNLRALYCTTVGLFLVSWWLHDHCFGRRQLTWWLPVVMLLWSNLHPGVITGQGLLLGAIGWEWINRWLKFNTPLDWDRLKRLTIIGGLGILATFLSPDPLDRLLYPFKPELAHPVQRWFVEMRPLHFFLQRVPLVALAAYLLAGCVLVTVVLKLRQFRGWELALLGGLTLLANVAVRCLQDWTLIMLALAVPKMRDLLVELAHADRRRFIVRWLLKTDRFCRRLLSSNMCRFQPFWPIAAAGVFLIISLIPPLANSLPAHEAAFWPVEPVRYAAEHRLHGRFFASPTHGAYIGWKLKENGLIYTDTRGFFFPPDLLEDSILIPAKGADWQARLDRVLNQYHTDYFLLDTVGESGALWRDLEPFIDKPLSLDERFVLLSAEQVRHGLGKMAQHQLARR
jgi:hypothetical protein